MINSTATIFINQPLQDVFNFATDPSQFANWMPGVASTKIMPETTLEESSKFTQYLRQGETMVPTTGTVIKFVKNQMWTYIGMGPNLWFRRTWTFEQSRAGTWIHFTEDRIKPGLMYNLVAPFVRAAYQRMADEGCQNLKRLILSKLEQKSVKVA